MEKYAFYLGTRKGSVRVKNKNTRPFAGVEGGLVRIRLQQLLEVEEVRDIVVSTNDPETVRIAEEFNSPRIKIDIRPDFLCASETVIEDLIAYIPTIVDAENIIWVTCCTPFADGNVLRKGIEAYEKYVINGEYDSLQSATKLQEHLWSPKLKKIVSHDPSVLKWPRSQDLDPLYILNNAFYINHRNIQLIDRDRIGKNPYMFELDGIQAFDIDYEDDFHLAEIIYKDLHK